MVRVLTVFLAVGVAWSQQDPARPRPRPARPPTAGPTADKPPEKPAAVKGQVLSTAGEALRKAEVLLQPMRTSREMQPFAATTDAAGQFMFEDIPPGQYQ